MADIPNLTDRIDAEFATATEKAKKLLAQQLREYQERKSRQERVEKRLAELREAWQPRLEAIVQRFEDRVQVTPQSTPIGWEDTLTFRPDVARVRLKFSASTDRDAFRLVLEYDLEVLPIFLRFAPRSRLELTPEALDCTAVGAWMDDRVIDFVRVYLSLQENDQYRRGKLVEDPVAQAWFPSFAAAATFKWNGQTYYFIAEETRREFERRHSEPARSDRSPRTREMDDVPAENAVVS